MALCSRFQSHCAAGPVAGLVLSVGCLLLFRIVFIAWGFAVPVFNGQGRHSLKADGQAGTRA